MIKKFEIWVADLNPRIGTEAGKVRPVLIMQTDLLNRTSHPSTIVCPLTTKIKPGSDILRIHIKKETTCLEEDCDIMIDQIRAIDNKRLKKKIGSLPEDLIQRVNENIKIILDID